MARWSSLLLLLLPAFGLGQNPKNVAPAPPQTQEPPLLDATAEVKNRVAKIKGAKPLIVQERFVDPITQPFIFGGRPAVANEFPHCVALGFKNGTGFSHCCTGTLIGPNVIVSAAHCADGGCSPSHVFFGLDSRQQNLPASQIYEVAHVIIKKEYRQTNEGNDIALIILKNPVTLAGVTPCPIASGADIVAGASLDLAGFGKTEQGISGVLHTVRVKLTDPSCANGQAGGAPCAKGLEFATVNNDGRDTCYGDSGGPAYIVRADGSRVLAGATSRGSRVCGALGIYTRVNANLGWIIDVAKEFGGVLPAELAKNTPGLPTPNCPPGASSPNDITAIMIRDRLGRWKVEYPEMYNKLFPGQ